MYKFVMQKFFNSVAKINLRNTIGVKDAGNK